MKVVIIGGNGFLGTHLVNKCMKKGYDTTIFDIHDKSDNSLASYFKGSLCDFEDLKNGLKGAEVVFHCASPPEYLNDKMLFYNVNIDGTKKLLQACKANDVKQLVLTSSASVVYDGHDICNGNEDMPYAKKPLSLYVESKIEQEKLVLAANDIQNGFLTLAIRPHGIFGPGDKLLVPQTLKAARENKLKFIIGDGKNIVDFTYVENVAHAMILSSEMLSKDSRLGGQAYNITNNEPVYFWDFLSKIVTSNGYKAPERKLSFLLVYYIALLLKFVQWILEPIVKINVTFTPQRVALIGTHHYYSCQKAIDKLNYKPLYDMKTSFDKMTEYFIRQNIK